MSRTLRFFGVALAAVAMVGLVSTAAMACPGAKADAEKAGTEMASAKSSCSSKASTEMASAKSSCSAKKANAEMASAKSSCSAKKAGAEMASAKSSCSAKKAGAEMASAGAGYCTDSALKACSGGSGACVATASKMAGLAPFEFVNTAKEKSVAVGVQSLDNGFAFVFAGGTEATIVSAKELATVSAASLGKPAACSYTRDTMVKAAGNCSSTEACLKALANAKIEVVETENGALAKVSSEDEAKIAELHAFVKSFAETEKSES